MFGAYIFWVLDNSHLVSDGMMDVLGIMVWCLTCFGCGLVCLWVGNFVG